AEPAPCTPGQHAGTACRMDRYGMGLPAAGCFVLGLFPSSFLLMLNRVGVSLAGQGLSEQALAGSGWLWLVPTSAGQASYSPIIFLVVIAAATLLTFLLVRRFY